jgi:transcriptional regulator with XRE-family HTH domain
MCTRKAGSSPAPSRAIRTQESPLRAHHPSFGELLKHSRQAAGLTQEALAARAGLSARAISDLERNVDHAPRAGTVQLLVAALPLSALERQLFEAAAEDLAAAVAASGPPAGRPRAQAPDVPDPSQCRGAPRLVGRARERALLERHLGGDGPPLLVVGGEPGIGKTRLLQEAGRLAAARRLHVLHGTTPAVGRAGASDPVVDALRREVQSRWPVHLRRDLQGCAWLVRVLPELATGPIEPLPSISPAPEQADALSAGAVVRFLTNVAGPAGTLLALDNLQDADAAALDLLARLVQSAADVPVRIVAAYRDRGPRPAVGLASLLARLAHEQLVRHVTLGPLSRPDAAALLAQLLEAGPTPPSAWRERVLDDAGGVPYYLVAWAQELRAGQLEPAAEAVPWAVRQSIRARVDALPPAVRPLLEAVAVAGGRSAYPLLVALTARPEEQVSEALEAACRERLLVEEGQAYRFAYGVIRRVVEADLGHARRALLGRRLAALVERAPGPRGTAGAALRTDGERAAPELEELAYHLAVLRRHRRPTSASG